jgi:hypothetical protein
MVSDDGAWFGGLQQKKQKQQKKESEEGEEREGMQNGKF